MEPRPGPPRHDEVPGAPFQVGDFVTYAGPLTAHERRSLRHASDYRHGGIVLSMRQLCGSDPDCDWRVNVQWPPVSAASRWRQHNERASYLARNLRLVRRAPTAAGGWPDDAVDPTVPLRSCEV